MWTPKKKLGLLLIFVSAITACKTTSPELTCTNPNPDHLKWGQVVYLLPSCWVQTEENDATLVLTSQETGTTVTFQKSPTPEAELPTPATPSTQIFHLSTGQNLTVTPSLPDDSDSKKILSSINITSFNLAPDDDCTPSSQSTESNSRSILWEGLTFDLPACWGAEESNTLRGDPQLALYQRLEGSEKYLRLNIWHDDPLGDRYTKLEDTQIAGWPAEHYVYALVESIDHNSHIFKLASTPVWYLETSSPDDETIQKILNSLTITPVTFEDPQ